VTRAARTRAEKRDIARKLHDNLAARLAAGLNEPALDAYIPELAALVQALTAPITGHLLADAQRTARLATLDAVDAEVDTWYRHLESYTDIESRRRTGPNVVSALALHKAAFPDGLAHIDAPIPDENRVCRESLSVLRAPEYVPTVAAIELPLAWLDRWESALAQSDTLHGEIEQARAARRAHVSAGQDAEADFVELCVRLRRYVASRAKSSDKARVAEGKTLLAPLLDELARQRATAAARATIRENEKKVPAPVAPVAPVAPNDGKPA
jgi:hypothetical protein